MKQVNWKNLISHMISSLKKEHFSPWILNLFYGDLSSKFCIVIIGYDILQQIRVLAFLSSHPNWVPQPPHPRASGAPPTLGPRGGHTRLRERGGGSQFGRKERHSDTLGIIFTSTICAIGTQVKGLPPTFFYIALCVRQDRINEV